MEKGTKTTAPVGTVLWQVTPHGGIIRCVVEGVGENRDCATVLTLGRTDVTGRRLATVRVIEYPSDRAASRNLFRWLNDAIDHAMEGAAKRIEAARGPKRIAAARKRFDVVQAHVSAWADRTLVSSR